jgi:hypothetical protein
MPASRLILSRSKTHVSNDAQHCCGLAPVAAPRPSDVVSPRTREALLAIENAGALISWCGLSVEDDRVRIALLQMYAERGRAPAIVDLAIRVGLSASQLEATLTSLEVRDVIVRDNDTGRIVGAYPFTEAQTEHRVDLGAQTLNAMCAIDALGIGAMYDRDVRIRSTCRLCGTSIEIATLNRGRELAYWTPEMAIVWSGISYEHACAANSLCKVLAFFCSDEHLAAWRRQQANESPGFRLSMEEGLEAARAIFERSLKTGPSGAITT